MDSSDRDSSSVTLEGWSSDEATPLLPEPSPSITHFCCQKYRSTKILVTSKSAILVLFWSIFVSLGYSMVSHAHDFYNPPGTFSRVSFVIIYYVVSVFLDYFYPLAGFLADVKLSKYSIVLWSVVIIFASLLLIFLGGGIFVVTFVFEVGKIGGNLRLILIVLGCIVVVPGVILLFAGFVGFKANVIQFGLNQLSGSSGEDKAVFLNWLIWTFFLAKMTTKAFSSYFLYGGMVDTHFKYSSLGFTLVITATVLAITAGLGRYCSRWFIRQLGKVNPYKLVYRVSQYIRRHKIPSYHSALVYCEDAVPSRLDFAKHKYGGPFATDQVEDVKTFYKILKVLAAFGPIFVLGVATNPIASLYYKHWSSDCLGQSSDQCKGEGMLTNTSYVDARTPGQTAVDLFLGEGLLSPFLVVVCIPLYLLLLRPFIQHYVPGPLKRMGMGFSISLVSVLFMFALEAVAYSYKDGKSSHERQGGENTPTRSADSEDLVHEEAYLDRLLVVEYILSALSHMLGYVAMVEFVCSQSPRSMTGLMIGMTFVVQGVYELGASILLLPLSLRSVTSSFPASGLVYYGVNLVVGMVGFCVFVGVAKRYDERHGNGGRETRWVDEYLTRFYDRKGKIRT